VVGGRNETFGVVEVRERKKRRGSEFAVRKWVKLKSTNDGSAMERRAKCSVRRLEGPTSGWRRVATLAPEARWQATKQTVGGDEEVRSYILLAH
jgi:hypothetical protein